MAELVRSCKEYFGSHVCEGLPANYGHEGNQYCVLHSPSVDKDLANFKEAIEKKLRKEDFDFRGIYFPEDQSFAPLLSNATFEGSVNFVEATFEGDADFFGVTFEGDANFSDSTFKGKAIFSEAEFKGGAGFSSVTFEADADLASKRLASTPPVGLASGTWHTSARPPRAAPT